VQGFSAGESQNRRERMRRKASSSVQWAPSSRGAGRLLGLPPEALGALVVFQAQPAATASYVLARQLGGDADLMASIVTAQTLLAFAVLPVAAGLLAG
jgi:predicted permease